MLRAFLKPKLLHTLDRVLRPCFNPQSASGIRRLQFFWMGCLCVTALGTSYAIVIFLFENKSLQKQDDISKLIPKTIETASYKVDLNEVWRHKIEDENKKLCVEIDALKALFEEAIKDKEERGDQELESKVLHLESRIEDLYAGYQPENPLHESIENPRIPKFDGEEERQIIQKFSLGLTERQGLKELKTVDTTIPAGAFAKTVLLSGLDASTSMTASSDPRPMLLRLIDHGTLPRRFQSDLKDCHCTASAFGDLSSERVYARLEKLTCIERKTGEIIETQVAGYVAGSDGKTGIRGIVASKDGQFLARSLVGGVFAGLSNVANPQNRQTPINPFLPGGKQPSPPHIGDMFTAGMASGASTALDRLSQYYIDRAEQLQPVIQIAAGQVVDIVFTEGTFMGAQTAKEHIASQKEASAQ
ncbi:MAG: TraB/VirB10 family protein [Proteobacteria bacterium]|nr:TraB/VirB10 family protein [Pseudomonadota bacterium]